MLNVKKSYRRAVAWLTREEKALVVSWFDVIVVLCFTMFVFMILGPLLDQLYIYMHLAPMNITVNGVNQTYYTDSDIQTADDLYDVFKWIPFLALGVVIYYAINYSNMRRGSE